MRRNTHVHVPGLNTRNEFLSAKTELLGRKHSLTIHIHLANWR